MNLLLEKRGYFMKIWFIWFLPACTAQSANASSIIWFMRPVELYIPQHVEWDLNKTSKTITETLLALTLMLYGSQKNVV